MIQDVRGSGGGRLAATVYIGAIDLPPMGPAPRPAERTAAIEEISER